MREYKTLILLFILFIAPFTVVMADDNSKLILPVEFYDKAQEEYGKQQWNRGKEIVDAGLKRYPDDSNLNTLAGKYWLHHEDYNKARFFLVRAVNKNYSNVEAKQMLVTVEDITGNYSSAICYINELLEINPYWEGLWRKKIELYKKSGNVTEANRLFKRLQQIYPNNQDIKDAYYYELEVEYKKFKKENDLIAIGNTLRELTTLNPQSVEYQLALINHYYNANLMSRAIDQAAVALAQNPGNIAILRKKIGILEETGQHAVAIERTKAFINNGNDTPAARQLYNELILESARQERQKDPYVLYGKIFEKDKNNREALDFLLTTAIINRYDHDALYYLREAKRIYGVNDKKIRCKEYEYYKAMGLERQASNILHKLHIDFPDDYDISYSYYNSKIKVAESLISAGEYSEAILELKDISNINIDTELSIVVMTRLFACYMKLERYEEAHDVYTYIEPVLSKEDALLKKSSLYYGLGREDESLQLFYNAIDSLNTTEYDASTMNRYIWGLEELSIRYIKEKTANGEYAKAYEASQNLLKYDSDNYYGVLYSTNMAAHLSKTEEFNQYTAMGRELFPNDYFFIIKEASLYDKEGKHEQSTALLTENMPRFSGNADFINAFSASSELLALKQAKEGKHNEAIETIDKALHYSPNSMELLYAKGLVYEQAHEYDSAYHYQKRFEPSLLERAEYISKMKGLKYKSNKNRIDYEYMQARFSEADILTSVASVGYERVESKCSYTARLNYSGRNGSLFWNEEEASDDDDGGTGYQLTLGYTRQLSHRLSGSISLGAGCSYFPKFIANAGATYYLNKGWFVDGAAGYRRLINEKNLINLSAGINKELDPFLLTLSGGIISYNSELFFNMQAKARYMPMSDGRTSITAAAGFGTAPELNIIDLYSVSSSFSHMNTFASAGGQYLLTNNLAIGLMGVWNTLYDQKITGNGDITTQYRNLYNLYVQVFISF